MEPQRFYGPCRVTARSVPVPLATKTLLAAENHARVGLILAVAGANNAQVAPRPDVLGNQGITLSQNGDSRLEITFADWGPLVGVEWWANAVGASTVEVIEVVRDFDPDHPILPLEY